MAGAWFYLVVTALALSAIGAEWWYDRRHQRGWHYLPDTLANLNLAAGNLVLGTFLTVMVLAGVHAAYTVRPVDLSLWLPGPVFFAAGYLLTELCQYWQHRLSHRWHVLSWGHLTHHSSSHYNLSTAIRVNWVYRSYAWLFYLPLPLVGVSAEQFVVYQGLINVYNLYCHTRGSFPLWERLGFVLVTPEAHRLHHSADPSNFGNYGASLVVFDRLFGTYRRLDTPGTPVPYGGEVNVDEGSPWALNVAHLSDVGASARAEGRSVVGELLSERPLGAHGRRGALVRPERLTVGVGVAVGAVVLMALSVQIAPFWLPWQGHVAAAGMALLGVAGVGRLLTARAGGDGE